MCGSLSECLCVSMELVLLASFLFSFLFLVKIFDVAFERKHINIMVNVRCFLVVIIEIRVVVTIQSLFGDYPLLIARGRIPVLF